MAMRKYHGLTIAINDAALYIYHVWSPIKTLFRQLNLKIMHIQDIEK